MRPRPLASPRARAACAVGLLAGLAFAAVPAAAAAPDCAGLPKHNGLPVVDAANVVDAEPEAWLAADLLLHHVTGHEAIVAATVANLAGDDVSSYATRLFDCWGIGDAKSDNGVLILVAMRERRVRIEVGAGLEGRLTDGQLEAAIDTMVAPLRRGDVAAALRTAAGTVARDLGGQLPDTKGGAGSGNVPPVTSPGDDVSDAPALPDVPDLPAGFPYIDGQVPDGIGPFDEPGTPGAGFAAFVPLAIAGAVIIMIIRAVTRAASSFSGASWRGGFPGYRGAWGPPSMLRQGSWHDPSSGSSFGSGFGGGFGGHSGGSSGGGSGGGSGSGGSSGSGSFGGGSSGGGGASGSW